MVLGKFSLFLEETLYSFFFLKQTVRLAINVIPFYSSESVTAHAPSLMLCMFSLPGVGGSLQPCACDSIFSLYRNFRSFVFFCTVTVKHVMVQMVLILATFLFLPSTPGPAGTKMEVTRKWIMRQFSWDPLGLLSNGAMLFFLKKI